ncbi:hypothetical protein PINS_up016657 [Pythium insidiosum]|nr:hypothetical protein PINS_up016657 [Pythium insidiosum]
MSAMKNPRATAFCPSEPTITIECDNDQGVKFSVCLVRPIANSTASGCEIDLECVKRADDPVETEFLCEHRDVAAVASLPSSLTYFSLSGNPLKCFKPSFPQGPSQLKSVYVVKFVSIRSHPRFNAGSFCSTQSSHQQFYRANGGGARSSDDEIIVPKR